MGNRRWTPEELEHLHEMGASGASKEELLAAFPKRTWHGIRFRLQEELKTRSDKHRHPQFDRPPEDPIDLLEYIDEAERRCARHRGPGEKDYRRVVIETDEPIGVMQSADWHFGGLDVDYPAMREHVRFLFDVPRMYLQLHGDNLNLMVQHRVVAARRDRFDADEQIRFLETLVHDTFEQGKLISMGSGNHDDEFTERNAGFGLVKLMAEKRVPYFRGLGYLDLTLRMSDGHEETYPIAFVHKTRFSSFMNPVHGNKRMLQMHNEFFGADRPIARVYVTAHTHNPAIAVEGLIPEQRIYFIKCGTFKTDDIYSQRYYGQGRVGVPTMVYHPDRFEHVGFPTPWEAYRYLQGKDWGA